MSGDGGRSKRREIRQSESNKSRAQAEEYIDRHLRLEGAIEGAWFGKVHRAKHDTLIESILCKVVEVGWSQSRILAALTHLEKRSRQIIAHFQLNTAPFQAPILYNRLDNFRSEASFHAGVAARKWELAFCNALTTHRQNQNDSFEFWMGLALFSAISRGNLLNPWQIGEVCQRLYENTSWLAPGAFDRPVMHFKTEINKGHYNCGTSNSPQLEWRFLPDAMTLALMSRVKKSQKPLPYSGDSLSAEVKAYRLISFALFGVQQSKDFTTLKKLCSACSWLVETRKGTSMPRALLDIATGKQPTVPLERNCYDHLWANTPLEDVEQVALGADPPQTMQSEAPPWSSIQRQFFEKTRESLQLYTENRRKVSISTAAMALIQQANGFSPGTIEHLITVWLEYRINRKSEALVGIDWIDQSGRRKQAIALSSALRYHNWISVPLVDRLAGVDLAGLSMEDFEDIYQDILDEEPDAREQRAIAGRLADLHNFAVHNAAYRVPPLRNMLLMQKGTPTRVRARTMAYPTYENVRLAVQKSISDPLEADVHETALILGYRCGLRIGEIIKLMPNDIENSKEFFLFIRQNRYGSNKSAAGRRKIAAGLILKTDELKVLKRVLATRLREGQKGAPLLLAQSSRQPLDRAALSANISKIIREVTGDSGWTFHHLRHSAANNTLFASLDAVQMAEVLAGWDKQHQTSVKKAILREIAPKQHRLNSLAAFLGHASPTQSMESYFHLAPELIAERTRHAKIATEIKLYGEALNIPPSKIADCLTNGDVLTRFQPRWKKLTERRIKKKTKPIKAKLNGHFKTSQQAPIRQCLLFLSEMEQFNELVEAAGLAQTDVKLAERWLVNARIIAATETRQGNKRFFAKSRITAFERDPERRELLLPGVPNPPHHLKESELFLNILWQLARAKEAETKWWLNYAIHNYSSVKSRIRFRKQTDLRRFARHLEGSTFTAERWQLDVCAPQQHNTKWLNLAEKLNLKAETAKSHMPHPKKSTSRRGGWATGHAELFLRETAADNKPIGENARVAAAGYLGYCLHLGSVLGL